MIHSRNWPLAAAQQLLRVEAAIYANETGLHSSPAFLNLLSRALFRYYLNVDGPRAYNAPLPLTEYQKVELHEVEVRKFRWVLLRGPLSPYSPWIYCLLGPTIVKTRTSNPGGLHASRGDAPPGPTQNIEARPLASTHT